MAQLFLWETWSAATQIVSLEGFTPVRNCENVSTLAKELGVDRSVLYHWRNLMPGEGGDGSAGNSPVRELRKEIRDAKNQVLARGRGVFIAIDPLKMFAKHIPKHIS